MVIALERGTFGLVFFGTWPERPTCRLGASGEIQRQPDFHFRLSLAAGLGSSSLAAKSVCLFMLPRDALLTKMDRVSPSYQNAMATLAATQEMNE